MNTTLETRQQSALEPQGASDAVDALPEAQDRHGLAPRPLPQRDTVAGHLLLEIWRKDKAAVFSRSLPDRAPHEYEVIIIRMKPEKTLPDGTRVPPRFAYSSNSDWGRFGWSVPKREYAIAWAQMVLANLTKPQRERTAWPELFSKFKKRPADLAKPQQEP